jgi:predicted deacetylase
MHGVTHQYQEFGTDRNQGYLEEGEKIFHSCFGFDPTSFKPPQLKISAENRKLIKRNNMELKGKINQMMHKVYHCNDSGGFKNWVIDLF